MMVVEWLDIVHALGFVSLLIGFGLLLREVYEATKVFHGGNR